MGLNERPDVLERVGAAMSSSDLEPQEGRIGAVELIAALAYAQLNPDASEHGEQGAAVIDPRTELAAVLVRLKYASDRTLGNRAVLLLARWVRRQKAFGRWRLDPRRTDLLEVYTRHCLAEWMYPVCPVCSGREMLGIDRGEIQTKRLRCTRCKGAGWLMEQRAMRKATKSVEVRADCRRCRGFGSLAVARIRKEKLQTCYGCMGSGRRRPSDAERARALGLEQGTYQRHWMKRFDWLADGLDRLDHLVKRCLQAQMRSNV